MYPVLFNMHHRSLVALSRSGSVVVLAYCRKYMILKQHRKEHVICFTYHVTYFKWQSKSRAINQENTMALLYLCKVFCFYTELSCVSTEWPSLLIWITVTFAQQTVESLWNLSTILSHKAISEATNTVLLSKHITEEACIAVAFVKLPTQAAVSMGMLYIFCRGAQS